MFSVQVFRVQAKRFGVALSAPSPTHSSCQRHFFLNTEHFPSEHFLPEHFFLTSRRQRDEAGRLFNVLFVGWTLVHFSLVVGFAG